MSKNNKLMALLSVWGIMLVVLGHSGFEEPIIADNLHYLHRWIYSFHMPLFFFISGYLYALTNPSFSSVRVAPFLQKKVLRLLVPYVVLGVVVFCIKYIFSGLSHAEREFSLRSFFLMFVSPAAANSTMGYLWYVITLFYVFVIVTVLAAIGVDLRKIRYSIGLIAVCWTLDAILPYIELFNFNALLRYLPFFIIGICYHEYEAQLKFLINSNFAGGGNALIYIVITIAFLFLPSSAWSDGLIADIVLSVIGILFSMSVCEYLLQSGFVKNKILPLANKTYSIYLLSWFGQYTAKVVIVNILHLHWTICVVAMFICGIMVPLLVCRIVDKIKMLSNCKLLRLIIGYHYCPLKKGN